MLGDESDGLEQKIAKNAKGSLLRTGFATLTSFVLIGPASVRFGYRLPVLRLLRSFAVSPFRLFAFMILWAMIL